MKNTLRQVFHSPKFVTGFVIFVLILLTMFIYPLINPGDPLEMIGVGTFAKPGTYVSMYDATKVTYETFRLPEAADKRIAAALSDEEKARLADVTSSATMSLRDSHGDILTAIRRAWENAEDSAP